MSEAHGSVVDRRRTYRSPQRRAQAQATRARILEAATEQFERCGYRATTVRAVASAAGVSVQTVELVFGSKAQLLKAALDVAVAGDDQPIPVLARESARRAERAKSIDEFLAIVAGVLAPTQLRAAGLQLAADEAAHTDADIQALTTRRDAQRAGTAGWIVDGVMRRATLRPGLPRDDAVDTVWLLMDPTVFRRLTVDRHWSVERYGRWFADAVPALLLPGPAGADPAAPSAGRPDDPRTGRPSPP